MSISAILAKAFSTTLLGMGTVFALLIVISLIIGWLRYIPVVLDRLQSQSRLRLRLQPLPPVMPQATCGQRAATIAESLPPLLLQPLPLMKQSMDRPQAATIT